MSACPPDFVIGTGSFADGKRVWVSVYPRTDLSGQWFQRNMLLFWAAQYLRSN